MAHDQSRRRVLKHLAIGGGLVLVSGAGVFLPRVSRAAGLAPSVPDPSVLAFFGDLRPGTKIGRWTLCEIHAATGGVVPVVLAGEDRVPFQVDLARRDPEGPTPIAETESLALYIANRGRGSVPTVEDHGLGVLALAAELRRREQEGARLPRLSTLNERVQRDRHGAYHVLGSDLA